MNVTVCVTLLVCPAASFTVSVTACDAFPLNLNVTSAPLAVPCDPNFHVYDVMPRSSLDALPLKVHVVLEHVTLKLATGG